MLGDYFRKNRLFFFHLFFWLVYLSFFLYQFSGRRDNERMDWSRTLIITSIHIFFTLIITYFNYLYLVPKFLIQKKFNGYFILFVIAFSFILFCNIYAGYLLNAHLYHIPGKVFSSAHFIIWVGANMLFIVLFVSSIGFSFERFELEANQKSLENERLSAEINFLKAQINPHFLFNTLNNLYYLAYTKSENTTEVISKLSQMMRYMIYDSNHDRVRLEQEIEYIENYISLEKLRLNKEIPIHFKISGESPSIQIAPLILITFLENAFKHGAGNNFPLAWIEIELSILNQVLVFQIRNSKPENAPRNLLEKSGIGLQNVKRRLELTYPNQYELSIQDEKEEYKVELVLYLND